MNINETRIFLQKLGLKIENWLRFSNFLSIYTFERLLKDYCFLFVDRRTERFFENTTDTDIINLILFDKRIGTNLLRWILMFETKLKKVLVEKWLDFYKPKNDKLYSITFEELEKMVPGIHKCSDLEIPKFKYSLFEYVSNSEFLIEYQSLDEIPIMDLSYSWSFATTINFFRVLDDRVKIQVLNEFNVPNEFKDSFHRVLNMLLKVRNDVSHNYIVYKFKSNLYKTEFNKIFKAIAKEEINITKDVSLNQVIYFIDMLLGWSNCKKEFDSELKELKINFKGKENLIKFLFGIEF